MSQRTEDRGQRTEDRGQRTEDRRQRTEDRGQRTEDRRQKTEDRRQRTEDRRQKKAGATNFLFLFSVFCLLLSATGCDAFVRKFTRKPKKEQLPQEEMVIAPEEYKGPQMTPEQRYRQYFLFWESWQDELISALMQTLSHKRQVSCARQAINNLLELRPLLNEKMQNRLDVYIERLRQLTQQIIDDSYSSHIVDNRQSAERIKRDILSEFSYNKISKEIAAGAVSNQ